MLGVLTRLVYFFIGSVKMKRQGGNKIFDFFIKRSKPAKTQAAADRQTELSSDVSHPGTSQEERQHEAQPSPSSPGQSKQKQSHSQFSN